MLRPNSFDALFGDRSCLILDGGLGSYLETAGAFGQLKTNDPSVTRLWAAGLLLGHPNLLLDAHQEFMTAGADILTSSSYQLSFQGLRDAKVVDPIAVYQLSTSLVRRCIEEQQQKLSPTPQPCPYVAASIGCYGAHLADGSEYKGNYGNVPMLKQFHSEQYEVLLSTNPDLIAFETIPCIDEIKAIVDVLSSSSHMDSSSTPCLTWISMACSSDTTLNSGETIEDALRILEESSLSNQSVAIGVNCTDPRLVENIIHSMRETCSKGRILVAYPNLGETWEETGNNHAIDSNAETLDPESIHTWKPLPCTGISETQFIDMAHRWYDHGDGATIIGGCCRVTPQLIGKLKSQFNSI